MNKSKNIFETEGKVNEYITLESSPNLGVRYV